MPRSRIGPQRPYSEGERRLREVSIEKAVALGGIAASNIGALEASHHPGNARHRD